MKERETGSSKRRSGRSSTDGKRSSRRRRRSSSRGSKSRKSGPRSSTRSIGVKRRRVPTNKNSHRNELKKELKVVKERAKRRQATLEGLQILNLVLQLCLALSVFTVVVCLYVMEDAPNHWFYFLLQAVIEVVLTIVISIIVCNPNTCFRILLISGHISTVIFSVFIVWENIRKEQFKMDCWDEKDLCIWQWPLKSTFEIGYLGIVSILLHALMFILSIIMVFYYEGSTDELRLKDRAHAILESQLANNETSRRKKDKSKKKKNIVTLEAGLSLRGKVVEKRARAVVVDKQGEPVMYGQTVTTFQSIYDTPKAVQEKGKRQNVLAETNGHSKRIVEMPVLESPIAYLTRKQKEANELKKSSYAF